jgi:serine/threonine protein kinase
MTSKGNILIDDEGNARLCDFGIARILSEGAASGLTTTSHHTGTDPYLCYELVTAEGVCRSTIASDVHALACTALDVSQYDITKCTFELILPFSSSICDLHMRIGSALVEDASFSILGIRFHLPLDHLSPIH